jgi:hypothetical protein
LKKKRLFLLKDSEASVFISIELFKVVPYSRVPYSTAREEMVFLSPFREESKDLLCPVGCVAPLFVSSIFHEEVIFGKNRLFVKESILRISL